MSKKTWQYNGDFVIVEMALANGNGNEHNVKIQLVFYTMAFGGDITNSWSCYG